jgi:hypothetical protein
MKASPGHYFSGLRGVRSKSGARYSLLVECLCGRILIEENLEVTRKIMHIGF